MELLHIARLTGGGSGKAAFCLNHRIDMAQHSIHAHTAMAAAGIRGYGKFAAPVPFGQGVRDV
jgi:hypothetical protein